MAGGDQQRSYALNRSRIVIDSSDEESSFSDSSKTNKSKRKTSDRSIRKPHSRELRTHLLATSTPTVQQSIATSGSEIEVESKRKRRSSNDETEAVASKKKKLKRKQQIVTDNEPARASKLDYHPQYKQILEGDFSFLPDKVETAEGPNEAALRRLEVGTWIDTKANKIKTAWMYVAKSSGEKDNTGKKPHKPAYLKELFGGADIQLKKESITFKSVFDNDERFQGSDNYKAVSNKRLERNNAHDAFLVDAYHRLVPDEEWKLHMAEEEKDRLSKTPTAAKRAQSKTQTSDKDSPNPNKEEENVDEGDASKQANSDSKRFRDHYGDFANEQAIWRAYNHDTARFDSSKDYVCAVVRGAFLACGMSGGLTVLTDDVIHYAMEEKRQMDLQKCTRTDVFEEWLNRAQRNKLTDELQQVFNDSDGRLERARNTIREQRRVIEAQSEVVSVCKQEIKKGTIKHPDLVNAMKKLEKASS